MNQGHTVFSQLIHHLPKRTFRRCVERYKGDHRIRSFACWDQYLCMAFAQLTWRESLRDIELCLRAVQPKLYHMGIRGTISRSTLADANEKRDWRIFADFATHLIGHARHLYAGSDLGIELEETAYALDSTTIDLCLSLFPWADFRTTKSAVKMHTLLDLRGSIPTWVRVTSGKTTDVKMLDQLSPEPGSIYIMDRGYLDFHRLHLWHLQAAYFIIRARRNLCFRRLYSQPIDRRDGLLCDQIIVLTHSYDSYPEKLRRIRITTDGKQITLLTNHFLLPAATVAHLYKCRWQVELFFKWIKQHLRIKKFYGTSPNAVKTQIWIAISVYVMVAIVKKQLNLDLSLYTILQILSVTLFEKMPLYETLTNYNYNDNGYTLSNQLKLFDF